MKKGPRGAAGGGTNSLTCGLFGVPGFDRLLLAAFDLGALDRAGCERLANSATLEQCRVATAKPG